MPWQRKGESKVLPSKSLVANILCQRHNNALAPIDELALRAFDAFTSAADYAATGQRPGRAQHYLISGEALELWMFKLAAGIHYGGIAAADGELLRESFTFPTDEAAAALTSGTLPPNSNLWVTQGPGLVQRNEFGVGPIIDIEANRNSGVQVQFGPLQFEATFVRPPISLGHFAALEQRRRPRIIDFRGPAREARVVLSWKGWPAIRVTPFALELRPKLER